LTEDVIWYPPESVPIEAIRGWDVVAIELRGDAPKRIFAMKTFRLTVRRILTDGDTAVVSHAISAKTREGKQYDNE
jgi:hypothetical protein